jgi:hypothetical protein
MGTPVGTWPELPHSVKDQRVSLFVGVDGVVEFVLRVSGQAHGGTPLAVSDSVIGEGDRDRPAREDVERVEVDVDRVSVGPGTWPS